jgi:hypothetical protein
VPQAATYTFVLRPQTASRLWVGGKLVADAADSKGSWGTWNWRGDAVALAAGRHRIVLAGLLAEVRLPVAFRPILRHLASPSTPICDGRESSGLPVI